MTGLLELDRISIFLDELDLYFDSVASSRKKKHDEDVVFINARGDEIEKKFMENIYIPCILRIENSLIKFRKTIDFISSRNPACWENGENYDDLGRYHIPIALTHYEIKMFLHDIESLSNILPPPPFVTLTNAKELLNVLLEKENLPSTPKKITKEKYLKGNLGKKRFGKANKNRKDERHARSILRRLKLKGGINKIKNQTKRNKGKWVKKQKNTITHRKRNKTKQNK